MPAFLKNIDYIFIFIVNIIIICKLYIVNTLFKILSKIFSSIIFMKCCALQSALIFLQIADTQIIIRCYVRIDNDKIYDPHNEMTRSYNAIIGFPRRV